MGSYLRTQFGVREADLRMGPPRTRRYKKHFEIPKGRKTNSKLGPPGGPTRNTFCINGPNSGSARRTPKWGRPGHGLFKNLAWVTPKGENDPKTGATLWPQFGVHQAGKPHKGHVSKTSMQNSIMGASGSFDQHAHQNTRKPPIVENTVFSHKTFVLFVLGLRKRHETPLGSEILSLVTRG